MCTSNLSSFSAKSTSARQGALATLRFNSSNAFYSTWVQRQGVSLEVRLVSGKLTPARPRRDRRKNCTNPRKERTSATFYGTGHCSTARTLSWAICTPFASISCPRNVIRSCRNLHFRSLMYRVYSRNRSSTKRKCYICSASLRLWIMISSKYTLTHVRVKSPSTLFIIR